jgi:predicted DNA-binding protein
MSQQVDETYTDTHIVGVVRKYQDVIRKQIFIDEEQNEALKRLAKKTGKSEGALIREALERRLMEEQDADTLWESLIERWLQVSMTNESRTWTREDLYDARLRRFPVNSD